MNNYIETVSFHSITRAKERTGMKNEKTISKNIALAMQRGKRAKDFTSWERNYLRAEAYDNCTAIAYNNYCYIVSEDGCCVTMYPLPVWFGRKKRFDGKERIRNYKQYCKFRDHNRDCCIYT